MSKIYNYINPSQIEHVDNYNTPQLIYKFNDVRFRTHVSSYLKFQTPIGVLSNNKIISLTNKQLSFLIQKYLHFLGDEYATDLKTTYNKIVTESNYEVIVIEEPAFQFFDYESVNGTAHSYDLMFFLLYCYKVNNLKAKMLVVESENRYYNSTLDLIKKYFHVDYIFIKPNQTYLFKTFICTRSYQNILFHEVKQFVNNNLINPIIKKYDELNQVYHENIIKVKLKSSINLNRDNDSFEKNDAYLNFCNKKGIFDLNNIDDDEELKIYYINKAKILIIQFSSIYYINTNYYLRDTTNKKIIVLLAKIHENQPFIQEIECGTLKQNMHGGFCGNITEQLYNTWQFAGELINIETIDDIELKIKI